MTRMTKAERYHEFARVLNMEGSIAAPPSSPWPLRLRSVDMDRGSRVIVTIDDRDTVKEVPPDYVINALLAWNRNHPSPEWLLTHDDAKAVVRLWTGMSEPLKYMDIKPVRWLTEHGLTWSRMPWDMREGATPTWDVMLSRMSNNAAFRAFIGSLFFDKGEQHQYVWCYGPGGDGKGAINRFLAKIFGHSYRSKQPPGQGDRWWSYGLFGARLVVFPDCNGKAFVAGGLFKSMSGGDPISLEPKGRDSFTAKLFARYIFFSNERPTLSTEAADMRRVVYCEFEPRPEGEPLVDPEFEPALWAEGGAFLTKCVQEYISQCPNGEPIQQDAEGISDWISQLDEEFEAVFLKHFHIPLNARYRTSAGLQGLTAAQLDLVSVRPEHLLEVMKQEFPNDRQQQRNWRDWAKKKYNIDKKSVRVVGGNHPIGVYVGMARGHRRDNRLPTILTTVVSLSD